MNAFPNAPQAWDRTRLMARRLGVDLPRAVFDGWLTRRDLDSLVVACQACGKTTCRTESLPVSGTANDQTGTCSNQSDILSLRF